MANGATCEILPISIAFRTGQAIPTFGSGQVMTDKNQIIYT